MVPSVAPFFLAISPCMFRVLRLDFLSRASHMALLSCVHHALHHMVIVSFTRDALPLSPFPGHSRVFVCLFVFFFFFFFFPPSSCWVVALLPFYLSFFGGFSLCIWSDCWLSVCSWYLGPAVVFPFFFILGGWVG